MKEKWLDTEGLDESLGEELDLDLAWAEFEQAKEKKRPMPFWFWSALGSAILVLSLVGIYYNWDMQKESQKVIQFMPNNVVQEIVKTIKTPATLIEEISDVHLKKSIIHPQKELTTELSLSLSNEKEVAVAAPRTEMIRLENEFELKTLSDRERSIFVDNRRLDAEIIAIESASIPKKVPYINTNAVENISREISWESPNLLTPLPSLIVSKRYVSPRILEGTNLAKIAKAWSFGISYEIGKSSRKIKGAEQTLVDKRQAEEQFKEFQSINFWATRTLGKRFYLQSGLAIGQYRSKFMEEIQVVKSPVAYENTLIETRTKDNVTEEIIGTAYGSQLTLAQRTRFQRYQTIALPVMVGIRLPLQDAWQLSAATGLSISVYHQFQGETFNTTLPDGNYTPIQNLGYRQAGVLEGVAQINIDKHWRDQWHFRVGLQARVDLNNRFKNKDLGQDKFSSYGLQFGVYKSF